MAAVCLYVVEDALRSTLTECHLQAVKDKFAA
jgi:hypothetical protein